MDTAATIDVFIPEIDRPRFKRFAPAKDNKSDSHPFDIEAKNYGVSTTVKGNIKNNSFTTQAIAHHVTKHLQLKIDSLRLPSKWHDAGINPPTIDCKQLAKTIVGKLYEDFSIIPERISTTVEEGIFAKYVNYANHRELSIEIYNDLDMVVLITQDDKTITCKEITIDTLSEIYKIFQERQIS